MLQYSHRGPPITGAASEVSPLKLRLGPPCEGCPERNQQGAQQKAPLHQLGPLAINQVNRSGNGGQAQQPSGAASGAPPAVCEEEAISIFPLRCGLGLRRLGCLGLPGLPGAAAAGWHHCPGRGADTKATPAVVRLRAIWRFMDRIGAGAWPRTSSSSDRSGCRPPSWIMGECEIGQVRSPADRPGTCRLPRPKLETSQSCSCD